MKTIIVMTFGLVAAGALANEVKVAEKDVPKQALDAVAKKYPKAKKVGFEKETEGTKVSYEVKLIDGDRKIDVDVSSDGRITAEEEVIAEKDVPATVRDALAKSPKYGKWTIKRVEKVIKDEKADAPMYEIVVAHDKAKAEVLFGADGKIVKTEDAEKD